MRTPSGFNYYQWGSATLWTAGASSRKRRGLGDAGGQARPSEALLAYSAQVAALRTVGSWIPAGHAGTDQCLLNNTELVRKNFFFLLQLTLEGLQTRRVLHENNQNEEWEVCFQIEEGGKKPPRKRSKAPLYVKGIPDTGPKPQNRRRPPPGWGTWVTSLHLLSSSKVTEP